MIDCARQLVKVRTGYPWGESLAWANSLFGREGSETSLTGCSGFLAYVSDTRVKVTSDMISVPIVRDFPDVFPEEFPGVPPERQMEFHIDLMTGAALIAKPSYHLAPPEMQELSTQL